MAKEEGVEMIVFEWCKPFQHYYYSPTSPILEIWTFGFFTYRKFLPTEVALKLVNARREVIAYQEDPERHAFTCRNGCGKGHIGMAVEFRPKEKAIFVCHKCGYEQDVDWEMIW